MMVATARLDIATEDGAAISDVTTEVNDFLRASGVGSGVCVLSTPSPDACLTLSADLDEDVDDLLRLARSYLSVPVSDPSEQDLESTPPERADRMDAEGPGYTPAGVLADCVSLPVREGAISLGTWEAVVLLAAGGPSVFPVDVTVVGS